MPQLDKVTFLSQFFWLAFFYIGFYFLILKYFLPKMTRIIKLRKKKMSISHESGISLLQENKGVRELFNSKISLGLNLSNKLINQYFLDIYNHGQGGNHAHYEKLNGIYLSTVGENALKDNLAVSQASINKGEGVLVSLFLSKIKI